MNLKLDRIPRFHLEDIYLRGGIRIKGRKAVVVDTLTRSFPLTVISERYSLLQHTDLIKFTRDALNDLGITHYYESLEFGLRQDRYYYGIMFYTVEFSTNLMTEISKEKFIPGITLINSVDTTVRLAILPRVTVVTCLNVLANQMEGTVIRKHVGNLEKFVRKNLPSAIRQCLSDGIQNTASLWDDHFTVNLDTVLQLMEGDFPAKYIREIKKETPETLSDLMQILTRLNTYDKSRNIESKYEGMKQITELAYAITSE